MNSNFSIKLNLKQTEDDTYEASLVYDDSQNNDIEVSAKGEDLEDVIISLYNDLYNSMEEEKEDLSDEEYITYLEDYIAELQAENKALLAKQNHKYTSYKYTPYEQELSKIFKKYGLNYAFSW